MGSAPNGKHPCTDQGSEMHIGGIHANQQIQPADQGQFLIQGILARHAFYPGILKRPLIQERLLVATTTEQEDGKILSIGKLGHDQLHLPGRINLSPVLGEGGDTDPLARLRSRKGFQGG